MKEVNIEHLVDYHLKDFLVAPTLFQQVYEEITTFAYWLKGFQAHNILEIGFKGSSFHIMSQLSTGKKVAVDLEDHGRTIWSHYMMYGEDFKLFIADSQTEETKNLVKEFCPQYDLIFIDGDHSYDGVKEDLNNWWAKCNTLFCGHDYMLEKTVWGGVECGVKKAVDEFVEQNLNDIYMFKVFTSSPNPTWFIWKK